MHKSKIRMALILMILFSILLILPSIVNAADTYTATSTINGVTLNWSYEVNESNEIINLKCTNPAEITGNFEVPSKIDNKTVISVGEGAFKSGINITGVSIPSSVKTIEKEAFSNCTKLTDLDLGNVEGLRAGAFAGCTSLESITIPKTLKSGPSIIDSYVFKNCSNLTTIALEEGLEVVPTRVCAGTSITSIIIPNSVKTIEQDAFLNCTELTKIEIYDNVEDFYGLDSTSEKVFQNHNDDLTIYCYEGSLAAQYAINHNIKYVYLTKTSTDDGTNADEGNTNTMPEESPSDSVQTPEADTKTKDTTTATGKLPQTGLSIGVFLSIIVLFVACVIAYFKYSKLRGI